MPARGRRRRCATTPRATRHGCLMGSASRYLSGFRLLDGMPSSEAFSSIESMMNQPIRSFATLPSCLFGHLLPSRSEPKRLRGPPPPPRGSRPPPSAPQPLAVAVEVHCCVRVLQVSSAVTTAACRGHTCSPRRRHPPLPSPPTAAPPPAAPVVGCSRRLERSV